MTNEKDYRLAQRMLASMTPAKVRRHSRKSAPRTGQDIDRERAHAYTRTAPLDQSGEDPIQNTNVFRLTNLIIRKRTWRSASTVAGS